MTEAAAEQADLERQRSLRPALDPTGKPASEAAAPSHFGFSNQGHLGFGVGRLASVHEQKERA